MTTTSTQPRIDVYARVTAKIIADLEQGVRTWQRPWSAENAAGNIMQPLRATGQPYRGVNVLLLWGEALDKGYTAPMWMTYKQAETLGAQVRKGEHGSLVVYADKFTKTQTDDQGKEAVIGAKHLSDLQQDRKDGLCTDVVIVVGGLGFHHASVASMGLIFSARQWSAASRPRSPVDNKSR